MSASPTVSFHSLLPDFGKKEPVKGVSVLDHGSRYQELSINNILNGRPDQLSIYDYRPKIIHFREANIVGGRYVTVGNNIWLIGATYFVAKMEFPGEPGGREANLNKLVRKTKSSRPSRHKKIILIGGRNNFGHFIFEILPKMVYLKNFIKFGYKFLLLDNFPRRFLDFCAAFGIFPEHCLFIDAWVNVDCEDLIVAGCLAHRNPINAKPAVSLAVFKEIRDSVRAWALAGARPMEDVAVLFITREQERWRRILNEDEIFREIVRSGAAIAKSKPHLLSAADQVRELNAARVVISPIGGSSPSSLFLPHDGTLVEISTPNIDGVFGHRIWCALFGAKLYQINGYYDEECENKGDLEIDRDFKVRSHDVEAALFSSLV